LNTLTLERLTEAVTTAGLEIYRVNGSEVLIAERVRMHLMDSGVSVALQPSLRVALTIRSQRSDFPTEASEVMFDKVRAFAREDTSRRGFSEQSALARDITDPVDATQILDVWHEVTFAKTCDALDTLLDDIRWALRVPKCVEP